MGGGSRPRSSTTSGWPEEMSVQQEPLGARYLIVNADDFGASPGVNRGVALAHEHGIVTSASLMVHGQDVDAAAELARQHPALSIGLHVDIAEWEYRDGSWFARYERVPADDADALRQEVVAQLGTFERLIRRPPTHLDSHQHAHRVEPLRSILTEVAEDLKIPLRHESGPAVYCGSFYGQSARGEPFLEGISLTALFRVLDELGDGITELGCHPAEIADLDTSYKDERLAELAVLCDPRVRPALAERRIVLASFLDVTIP